MQNTYFVRYSKKNTCPLGSLFSSFLQRMRALGAAFDAAKTQAMMTLISRFLYLGKNGDAWGMQSDPGRMKMEGHRSMKMWSPGSVTRVLFCRFTY